MDSPTQPSFIPQDAAALSSTSRMRSQGGLSDLLLLLAIVLFVASVALAGAVFLYDEYLKTDARSKVAELERARQAFEPSLIHTLTRLDDRMHVADQLLGSHLAPTAFFRILEQATLETISFETLEYLAIDPQRITVKMTGLAESVNSVALQADLFSKNGSVTNPIFSDINREEDGVRFNLTALVNPAAVNFVRLVNGLSATDPAPQTIPQTQPAQGNELFGAPPQQAPQPNTQQAPSQQQAPGQGTQ